MQTYPKLQAPCPLPPPNWYHQDERLSVRALTAAASCDYTAMGKNVTAITMPPAPTVTQRYRFTGRELNPYSGNYYFRYRTYAPGAGMFTARFTAKRKP